MPMRMLGDRAVGLFWDAGISLATLRERCTRVGSISTFNPMSLRCFMRT
jgi:hypothetical protein